MTDLMTLYKKYLLPQNQSRIALVTLIAANTLPVFGVLFFNWNAFNIVLLYWVENLIIGFYNILKIAVAKCSEPIKNSSKFFLIPFFVIHFGGFCAVHGFFVFMLFNKDARPLDFFQTKIPGHAF